MLAENHPLFPAEVMLQLLFEKAPADQFIEFRCIWNQANKTEPPKEKPFEGRRAIVLPCPINKLEQSFDVAISDQIMRINKAGYDIFFGVCPRLHMGRYKNMNAQAGSRELVSTATCAWMDYDEKNWKLLDRDNAFPRPSIVVSTGHGAHYYFRYGNAVDIDKATADSESIAKRFGGDKCWDSPRILRLPGTKNWKEPGADLKAELVLMDPDVIFEGFEVGQVVDAPVAQAPQDINDIADFQLRNIIRFGYDMAVEPYLAQKEGGKIDRSTVDFRVAAALLELKYSRDRIIEIFTDEEYGISGKTLEEAKNGNAENYLARTLDKAEIEVQKRGLQQDDIGDVAIFETCDELDAAPPQHFAVQALLPVGGLLLISGPAKAGKSLMALDLVLLLSGAKGKFLDTFNIDKPGTVAYFQAEVTKTSLRERLMKIAVSRDAAWRQNPIHFLNRDFELENHKHVTSIINGLKKIKADYMIIDPLACFHNLNENNHGDMSRIMKTIRRIASEAGVMGTVVVHHHGKPVEGAPREGIQMLRGATVIGDRANSSLTLTTSFDDVLQKSFVTARFALRDAKTPNPMKFIINEESLRFEAYADDDEKLKIVREAVARHRDKKDVISEIRQRLHTSVTEAERLVAKEKFFTTQKDAGIQKAPPPMALVDENDIGEDLQ